MSSDVARIACAYHLYLEGIMQYAKTFSINDFMERERYEFIQSSQFRDLKRNYESSIPEDVRVFLNPHVDFLLKRILNPNDENDPRLPKHGSSIESIVQDKSFDEDDGND